MAVSGALVPTSTDITECDTVTNSNIIFPVGVLKKIPRTSLSINDKVKIIEMVKEKRLKMSEIADRFGLPKSTLSTLIKNKEKILNAYRTMKDPNRKRLRAAAYPDLEEMLFNWISDVNASGKIVSPQLLKVKAEGFARGLGIPSFRTSAGWLHNFKKRNGLKFPKASSKFVGPEFSNIIDRSTAVVPYQQHVSHDSDGAGSERSSDSDSAIHPVQLLQYERPKRLKRNLSEYRPDFIFYENSVAQKNTEQMIVPYVQNTAEPEWPEPSHDENIQEPQVKIEEESEEDDDDDYEETDNEQEDSLPSSPPRVQSQNTRPNEPGVLISNVIDTQEASSRRQPVVPSTTPSNHVLSKRPVKENGSTAFDIMGAVLSVPTQSNSKDKEPALAPETVELQNNTRRPPCSNESGHTCDSIVRLAESLERQAKAQEELLALKKARVSAEAKQQKEEIELLKKRLAVEEKKVLVLEKLLAAYMEHPKSP